MSDHHPCVLGRDSPPSLDLSSAEDKFDSPELQCPSMPITPSTPIPLDFDEVEIPSKVDVDHIHFEDDAESKSYMNEEIADSNSSDDKTRLNLVNDPNLKSDLPLNRNKETISNNTLNNSDNSSKCDVNKLICNQSNDNIISSNIDIKLLKNFSDSKLNSFSNSTSALSMKKSDNESTKREPSIPKLISTLTLTDDHPLMVLSSPDSPPSTGNYPDLILPSCKTKDDNNSANKQISDNHLLNSDCSGIMSLSSTEDDSLNRSLANGDVNSLHSDSFSTQYGPQRNTSKNNLYFSDTFVCSDGNKSVEDSLSNENINKHSAENNLSVQPDILDSGNIKGDRNSISTKSLNPPDIAIERKKIKPDVKVQKKYSTIKPNIEPYKILGREINPITGKQIIPNISSSPKISDISMSQSKADDTTIDIPSDMSTIDDIPSPDSSTASRPENERSLYLAEVDPYGGCVSLKPRLKVSSEAPPKKRIKPLLTETDTESTVVSNTLFASCQNELSGSTSSIDSLSDCSLHSDSVFQDNIPAMSNSQIQTGAVLKQICALKEKNDDECSDTETETECPLKNKRSCTDEGSEALDKIPEYSLSEERQDTRRWLKVTLPSGEKRSIDMKVIEPYKRVLSHGGYALSGRRDAIVVFSACYLPDSSRVDYNYVMDNLFLYVLTTLEQLVTDDYILVYLHGSASKRSMPTFHWLKKCYHLIDRRLRKSLKHLYLVHPTFWLKSIMWMTKPFISTKFSRKLSYVHTLEELEGLVPVEYAAIPEKVRRYDSRRTSSV